MNSHDMSNLANFAMSIGKSHAQLSTSVFDTLANIGKSRVQLSTSAIDAFANITKSREQLINIRD